MPDGDDPSREAWVEFRRKLPGGGTFTRLRPGPRPEEEDQSTRHFGYAGKRLVRFQGHTLALSAKQAENFNPRTLK